MLVGTALIASIEQQCDAGTAPIPSSIIGTSRSEFGLITAGSNDSGLLYTQLVERHTCHP